MIKIFSKFKVIFYFVNFCLVFLYLFPGSLLGMIIYGNKKIQPQITPDFYISSNHFYVFTLISIIGFLSFIKNKEINYLIAYLVFLSIILEIFHLFIPERSFQWPDLFGNLAGVLIVIFIKILIYKYGIHQK
jgi:VanZ family protein